MAGPSCHNCVYSVCDPELWLRLMWTGEPVVPHCANHPQWPGQLRDVPGVPCRNYRPKPALPQGDSVRMIPLGDGFYAYVDAADYEELSRRTWRLENGYATRYEKNKRIFMHRQIMQPSASLVVDHIDANRANNCRFNLRVCTRAENQHNLRKRRDSHSQFKGIFLNKRQRKWYAVCRSAGRAHFRGYFDAEADAARAYDRLAVEWLGESARVNFPKEWPPKRRQEIHAQHPPTAESPSRHARTAGLSSPHAHTPESSSAHAHTPESPSARAHTPESPSARARTPKSPSAHVGTPERPSVHARTADSLRARRGESSFAHSSSPRTATSPPKAKRRKPGNKGGKTTDAAQTPRTEDGRRTQKGKAKRRKQKTRAKSLTPRRGDAEHSNARRWQALPARRLRQNNQWQMIHHQSQGVSRSGVSGRVGNAHRSSE